MRIGSRIMCPYCDLLFSDVPPDQSTCPTCGGILHVFHSPLTNRIILMSDEGLFKIAKPTSATKVVDYFSSRMLELEASFNKAKASTTHYGELGRQLESLVKNLLSEYLPNKYKTATGFVRTLEKPGWQSNQIDIILSRSDICYPIAVLDQYSVFPIESVVSFVEVTSNLTPGKLLEDFEKVAELQRLCNRIYYVPGPLSTITPYFASESAVHPRFYYFAFSTSCSTELIEKTMIDLGNDYGIQLHALYVLKPSTCYMMPNARVGVIPPFDKVITETDPHNSIVSFMQHILISLQTADFIPPNASIPFAEYFKLTAGGI
jgi:hypothetical protein